MTLSRRSLFKGVLALAAASVVPKALAAEPEWLEVTEGLPAYAEAPLAVSVYRASLYDSCTRFARWMNALLGQSSWHVTVDYKEHSTTLHVPEWLEDAQYEWLRREAAWYRSCGELWYWRRGDEDPVEGPPFEPSWLDEECERGEGDLLGPSALRPGYAKLERGDQPR